MLGFSYTITPELRNYLLQIESLRREILIFPLSPRTEIRLQFEAMLERLSLSSQLTGTPLPKTEIAKLLTHPSPLPFKGIAPKKLTLLLYRQSLNHVFLNWTASPTPLTIDVLESAVNPSDSRQPFLPHPDRDSVKDLLNYLQSKNENPVVQSALSFFTLHFSPAREFLAYNLLLPYLLLAKHGYMVKNLLVLEKFFIPPQSHLSSQLNLYLEYFTQSFITHLEQVRTNLLSPGPSSDLPLKSWNLTDRQLEIITTFKTPNSKITNHKIQQLFGISQITASRDLAKLASLNLIFPHGKGRSTHYTFV